MNSLAKRRGSPPTGRGARRGAVRRPFPARGQLDLNGKRIVTPSLQEKIPLKPHTLIVGIMPAATSANAGHYYAGKNNSFWKLLHYSDIWPGAISPDQDDLLVDHGFGFTDACARPSADASLLTSSDFAEARNRILKRVREFKPRTVVFVSKKAIRTISRPNDEPIQYGLQPWRIGGADVFLVPSTSGLSLSETSYREKLEWFRRLKTHISAYWTFPGEPNLSSALGPESKARARST